MLSLSLILWVPSTFCLNDHRGISWMTTGIGYIHTKIVSQQPWTYIYVLTKAYFCFVAELCFLDVYIHPWLLNYIFWMYIYVRGIQRVNVKRLWKTNGGLQWSLSWLFGARGTLPFMKTKFSQNTYIIPPMTCCHSHWCKKATEEKWSVLVAFELLFKELEVLCYFLKDGYEEQVISESLYCPFNDMLSLSLM